MFARRFLVCLALAGLFLTSFAFFCTRRGAAVVDLGIAGAAQAGAMPADPAGHPSACMGDTKLGFFQTNPMTGAGDLIILATAFLAAYSVISSAEIKRASELLQDRLRQKLKQAGLHLDQPPLLVAFSRGILHPKRYAE